MSPSDVFEPAEFASVFFFLFLCKKGERKKGSSECGPSLLKNNAAEARACKPGVPTCVFLSEKSTLFAGSRRNAVGPHFFCLWEGRNGPAADGRGTAREPRAEQHRRNNTREARGKREEGCFSFSRRKIRRCLPYLLGGDSGRSAAIAALEV